MGIWEKHAKLAIHQTLYSQYVYECITLDQDMTYRDVPKVCVYSRVDLLKECVRRNDAPFQTHWRSKVSFHLQDLSGKNQTQTHKRLSTSQLGRWRPLDDQYLI